MYDHTLILESLEHIEELIENLLESTSTITDMADLPKTADGMLRLNGICMSFLVVGEEFKKIDRYSDKKLLPNYPEIPWKNVMGLRDKIAHGYFADLRMRISYRHERGLLLTRHRPETMLNN